MRSTDVSARIRRTSPASVSALRRVRSAGAALRPAAVIGADVDPGEDDLPVTDGDARGARPRARPRARSPLGAAGQGNDAVGAVERAAVLDLDERPGRSTTRGRRRCPRSSLRPRPRPRGSERASHRARRPVGIGARAQERLELGQERGLRLVGHEARPTSILANASGPTWTEQPVTTISASRLARRARRTAARDFSSATVVTVQVFTSTRSAPRSGSTSGTPASRSSRAAPSISDWLTLQPRLTIDAERGASPQVRLRRHHEGDEADGRREPVRDVALAARPIPPGGPVRVGLDAVVPGAGAAGAAGPRTRRRRRPRTSRGSRAARAARSIRGPSTTIIAIPVRARPAPMTIVPCAWTQDSDRTTGPVGGRRVRRDRAVAQRERQQQARADRQIASVMCVARIAGNSDDRSGIGASIVAQRVGFPASRHGGAISPGGGPPARPSRPRPAVHDLQAAAAKAPRRPPRGPRRCPTRAVCRRGAASRDQPGRARSAPTR